MRKATFIISCVALGVAAANFVLALLSLLQGGKKHK